MKNKDKIGIFIASLQPVHNVHLAVIKLALKEVGKLVIILGSDCQAKTIKKPWSSDDRINMLYSCLTKDEQQLVSVIPIKDYLYNDNIWLAKLQSSLSNINFNNKVININDYDVVLYGHNKDRSTNYLNLFPQWEFKDVGPIGKGTSSEIIRNMFFQRDMLDVKRHVPNAVFEKLKSEIGSDEYERLYDEFKHIEEYKAEWSKAPYPPTFVTTDAILIKSGHVLLVTRKMNPGKGLFALPGGFLNQKEHLIDGCIRELKEETGVNLPKDELKKRVVCQKVFDNPDRSLRGRTITHAFHIDLGSGKLPKVKGSDDAENAFWMPLSDVEKNEDKFFEDHFHMINFFMVNGL